MAYLLTKTAHLVFVIAWMAGVFYLPRILVNIAEAGGAADVRARLLLMGRRLYRFGHVMFARPRLLISTAMPSRMRSKPKLNACSGESAESNIRPAAAATRLAVG